MTASYYRGASGIMVVYDITDPESFNNINSWLIEIEKYFDYNLIFFYFNRFFTLLKSLC